MKITVFNGSPAGADSATNVIVKAFLEGAMSVGAEVENIFLTDYSILQCKGCFSCWFKTLGKCVLEDDMEKLLELYNKSDVVCFATPIYTWNMTGLLKNFIDRLIPLKSPSIKKNDDKFDLKDTKEKTQKFIVISNSGFPGERNFDILRVSVSPCNPSLEIYRNCGKLLKSKKTEVSEKVDEWLKVVFKAGEEFAKNNKVSDDTIKKLDMPLMTVEDYIKYIQMG